MKITGKRILIVIPILLVVLGATVWACSYHTSEFKGGIGIHDSGFFSYPRYHAEIGQLPLWKDGEYQFKVKGLPPDSLDLSVQVLDATLDNASTLTSLSTQMSVSIIDSDGKQVSTAEGSLSDAQHRSLNSWVLASSSSHAAFWHPRCQQLPISRSKAYTVNVALSGVDGHSPHKMLMAVLQGGGNELP
jgi:hypothetical protein